MHLKNHFCVLAVWLLALSVTAFDNVNEHADIVWHNNSTQQNTTWNMNRANYLRNNSINDGPGSGWHLVATADFDRDGFTDLLWHNPSTSRLEIWLMTMLSTNLISTVTNRLPVGEANHYVVGAGDLNGDGFADIIWHDNSSDGLKVWYLNRTTFLGANTIPYHTGPTWRASAIGDCNNDGYADIIWRETTGAGNSAIWFMADTNLVTGIPIDATSTLSDQSWKIIGVAQLDRAGNTDIIWQKNGAKNLFWMMASNHYYYSGSLPLTDPDWEMGGAGGYNTRMLFSSTTSSSPASHLLTWRYGYHLPSLQWRTFGSTTWTDLLVNTYLKRYTNSGVAVGTRYEYRIKAIAAEKDEFLVTAINEPPVHDRGKIILVVDQSQTNQIEADLMLLKTNLVGDGWTVIRTNVARHIDDPALWSANTNHIAQIKSFIVNNYLADPVNTKSVLLIGHVPVPYSGGAIAPDDHPDHKGAPDGHPDHMGAWSADGYYGNTNATVTGGDRNTQWTDSATAANSLYLQDDNRPNDGKWDNDYFPQDQAGVRMHLAVGRVDFAKMPDFSKTESQLLTQYVQKNSRYRNKQFALQARGLFSTWWGDSQQAPDIRVDSTVRTANRTSSRWFGMNPGNTVVKDFFNETTSTFLFGALGGPGGYFYVTGSVEHHSSDLAIPANEPQGGFYFLHGSFFADFNLDSNNIMRGLLATPNYGLATLGYSAVDPPSWYLETMGLGGTLGEALLRSINAKDAATIDRFVTIIGDPTLRAQILAPPAHLNGNTGTNVDLTWTEPPSSEGAVQYFVYRSVKGLDGPWTLLNRNATSNTFYSDNPAPAGAKMYRVRAAKLTTTGSGSYTNLSQGIFLSLSH